jgi:hypothetical protein
MLRDHLNWYVKDDPDRRVFVGKRGGPITDRIYLKMRLGRSSCGSC